MASPSLLLERIAPDALVCDAGYPKNLAPASAPGARVFAGGLGQITGGLRFDPDLNGILNRHPFPNMVHGCLLEGMALALEGRPESFSYGRGRITPQRVDEILSIADRHGIYLAPLIAPERRSAATGCDPSATQAKHPCSASAALCHLHPA
jgi:predicted amino acid dehydrogenase